MNKSFKLRSEPSCLNIEAVMMMLKQKGFFDKYKNPDGKGIKHQYKTVTRRGVNLVIDHATGLTWQQSGSDKYMNFADAQKYIAQLNREKFAGYNDWRLPTLEEAMSLMEPKENSADLYIDPVFYKSQRWIWTADERASVVAWIVDFSNGGCDTFNVYDPCYVRAVRSGQS